MYDNKSVNVDLEITDSSKTLNNDNDKLVVLNVISYISDLPFNDRRYKKSREY